MLVYGLSELIADPLSLFTVWKGGMSFHGGLIGVILAMILFTRSRKLPFFALALAAVVSTQPGIQ